MYKLCTSPESTHLELLNYFLFGKWTILKQVMAIEVQQEIKGWYQHYVYKGLWLILELGRCNWQSKHIILKSSLRATQCRFSIPSCTFLAQVVFNRLKGLISRLYTQATIQAGHSGLHALATLQAGHSTTRMPHHLKVLSLELRNALYFLFGKWTILKQVMAIEVQQEIKGSYQHYVYKGLWLILELGRCNWQSKHIILKSSLRATQCRFSIPSCTFLAQVVFNRLKGLISRKNTSL